MLGVLLTLATGLSNIWASFFLEGGGRGWRCRGWGWGRRTLRVVLQDLQVHVCVRDDDVELLVMGEEFSRDAFELVFAAAEEHHFVWFFLFTM